MVDYRKFLGAAEPIVAPYFGGASIDAPGRRLQLGNRPEAPGWFRFQLKGRLANVVGPAEPPSLDELPKVRGFLWANRLVTEGALAEPLAFLPEDELPRFSPVTARRWHGGTLLFDTLEFESGAEGAVREALARGGALSELKGVPAPLRAAYAFALLLQTAHARQVRVVAAEVLGHVASVAQGGRAAAVEVINALLAERELALRELRVLHAARAAQATAEDLRVARTQRTGDDAADRAWTALDKAGAALESTRHLAHGQLEVVFAFMGERFIALVDDATLQVIDSGICLGHPPRDELLTLDSLPAVIREAIDTHRLVILREP